MSADGMKSSAILDELEEHLREDVAERMRAGQDAESAFEAAAKQIGQSDSLRREFRKAGGARSPAERWLILIALLFVSFIVFLSSITIIACYNGTWQRAMAFAAVAGALAVVGGSKFAVRFMPIVRNTTARITACLALIGTGLAAATFYGNYVVPRLETYPGQLPAMMLWAVFLIAVFTCAGMSLIKRYQLDLAALPLLEDFAPSGRLALEAAPAAARYFHHNFVGTEHLLLSLTDSPSGTVTNVMRNLGISADAVRREITKIVGVDASGPGAADLIPMTPRARHALRLAADEANRMRSPLVGSEHIFLGLLREGSGVAAIVLKTLGVSADSAKEEILREISAKGGRDNPSKD